MLEHCSHLSKGMVETVKRSGGWVQGWIVLPSYDHHVDAAHYLSCQSVSFIRDIKKFIKRVVVFQQVQYQIPYMAADGTLSVQQSRKQLQNQVALLLHTGKGNPPMGEPITMDLSIKRDLSWGMSRLNLDNHVTIENNHLRFYIHPGIMEEQSISYARDFYEWVNKFFSPVDGPTTECSFCMFSMPFYTLHMVHGACMDTGN